MRLSVITIFSGLMLFILSSWPARLVTANSHEIRPSDKRATKEARALYHNLFKMMDKGIMFGHQDDLAYGVGWQDEDGRSDVKSVTGSYPGVYGWDMGNLELDSAKNFDGVPFDDMVRFIREVYDRGGVNTISWHFRDPVTQKTSWSTPDTSVHSILTNKESKEKYIAYLERFNRFVTDCKGPNKELIPIIFRPLHENTGSWFWWGKKSCSPEDFKALWKFTVNYLRKEKKLHNLLFAYSPADFDTEEEFMERYPGDEFVDVIGTDIYCDANMNYFTQTLQKRFAIISKVTKDRKKLPALTEMGYERIPKADWWTKVLLPAISPYQCSYMLAWRNWKKEHFYAPYPGQVSESDFKVFYNDPKTLFQNDVNSSMYKQQKD